MSNEIESAVEAIQIQLDMLATKYGIHASLLCTLPDGSFFERNGAGVDYLTTDIIRQATS